MSEQDYGERDRRRHSRKPLSELGKRVLDTCPRAYVNERGEVIDPCHVWWSNVADPTAWMDQKEN